MKAIHFRIWDSICKHLITESGGEGETEDELAGRHHWLNGHECEQVPGVGDGQGGLVCCSPWGRRESDTTERLNWRELVTESTWWSSCNDSRTSVRWLRFHKKPALVWKLVGVNFLLEKGREFPSTRRIQAEGGWPCVQDSWFQRGWR